MRRFIVFGLIGCLAACLSLPLAGCKGSGSDNNNVVKPPIRTTGTSNSSSSGSSDETPGALMPQKKRWKMVINPPKISWMIQRR